jgi:hypothetical protein
MNPCATRTRFLFISSTLMVLLLAPSASGTVIYVRVSGEKVVIAADSKRVVHKRDGNKESASVCKIHQVGDVVFASAGIVGGTGIALDVGQVARQAMSGKGPLLERAQTFQRLMQAPLIKTLEIVRTRDPAQYRAFSQGAAVQTVFMRVQKQAPVVAVSIIQPVGNANGTIELDSKVSFYSANQQPLEVTLSVGESPRAYDLEDKDKEFWDKGSVAGVRELMKISIADNAREAGEPIDILRFTKDGTTWIQGKPECKKNKKVENSPKAEEEMGQRVVKGTMH